jgi:Arc/MetJ-type ribon-helix-helix transcriptional regulator
MPEKGEYRDQITFKCTTATIAKIDSYIGKGEFTSRNEVIRAALEYYFENKGTLSPTEKVKEWLKSPEGEEYLKNILRKTRL